MTWANLLGGCISYHRSLISSVISFIHHMLIHHAMLPHCFNVCPNGIEVVLWNHFKHAAISTICHQQLSNLCTLLHLMHHWLQWSLKYRKIMLIHIMKTIVQPLRQARIISQLPMIQLQSQSSNDEVSHIEIDQIGQSMQLQWYLFQIIHIEL